MRWLLLILALVLSPARADEALWPALRGGGHVLLIRHAQTDPGVGDPPGFRLEECATQRNLSAEGRAQARALGAVLRARQVPLGEVLSSPWCRCVETAELAFGRAQTWDALSNLHGRPQNAAEQVRAMRPRIAAHRGADNLVLVSHGSTAGALTGEYPAMGEVLVLKPQPPGFRVVGRISLP
ncbi:MAG: histidine phosphatase family protein [Betaproteobacteria bacterium]|nr:histidine phosphatase family protein [Betaproteobacteria bacterium]MDH5221389.1 histidine phosphatase family protein [Betaproteobacteria bacterium]MDH5349961.1 histidine phosphatase family protein [Betaproteobacteria bacterium]